MPDFWENDAVADSGADWWKADAVATSAPTTTTVEQRDYAAEIEANRKRGPYTEKVAPIDPAALGIESEPITPSLRADTTSPVGRAWRRIRESLTPIIGPTESQLLRSENIDATTGEVRYKPLGSKIDSLGLIQGSFDAGPKLPRIEQQENQVAQQLAGTYNAVANLVEPMLSVGGVGTVGLGALGPVAARAAGGYFAADMALHLKDAYKAVEDANTPQEATTALLTLAGTVALIGKSSEIAIKGVPAPLADAAAKAEAAGAPATAEALKAQAIETKVAEPLIVEPEIKGSVVETTKRLRPLGELYSEPLSERIRRFGGPVAGRVADESLQIINRAKRLYGDLSARVLDDAKLAAGKAFRGGTTWIQGVEPVTERAATSRFHDVLEQRVTTGNFDHVPAQVRPLAEKLWNANLEIGRLAQQANPEFVATGKAQRMLTAYGHDIVLRGRGRAWDAWAEGLAAANGRTVPDVKTFLRRWKAEMDKPGADAAGLDRISQDFVRQFPKVVTHVKPLLGWHEVVHSSPFSYLEQAAQRTANAVAFREVHPVGSGSVEATRTAVQAELPTDRHGAEFDNTMRALQGHPIDQFTASWNAPDTVIGATLRATQIATKPLRSAMLSSSLPTNIGESLSGGAQIFLGYGNAIRGAVKARTLYRDLERAGMVNKAIRDFSFDPTQPARSVSRYAGNMISRVFMNDFANEFQEYTGAATARLIADEVRAGTIDAGTKVKLVNTMRAMGITKENAQAAAEGRNTEALNQFETKAAEFLSAGSQVTGEKSRLGASRAFGELFWFHSYPMSKVRQVRSVMNNIIEDATAKDWKSAYQNSSLLGKTIGGTALGGAITIGVLTLLREGLFGTEIKKNEAQDDFGEFAKESLLMGFGGPLQIANRIWEQGGGIDDAAGGLVLASAPISLAKELSDAATQSGRYEGMTPVETVGEFLQSKTPGLKPFKRGMAVWGLSQDDPEFDASARAFYRWRNDRFGSAQYKAHLKEDKERKEFRGHMKQAVAALKDGDMDRFDARLDAAAEVAGSDNAIKQSFDSRKLLRTPSGKKLAEEELDELRERIGEKAVDKLLGFDAMLESLSR